MDIDFAANHVDERDDNAQAWLQDHAELPEAFDGPLISLRDYFDARDDHGYCHKDDDTQTQKEKIHTSSLSHGGRLL